MSHTRSPLAAAILVLLALTSVSTARADDSIQPSDYQDLEYRLIGPFRASRTVGGVGIPDQPGVFFIGVNNGGVWKTDDFGRTWNPIFDDAPTGSIGDLAVSPSHPDVIYVGTGEGLHRPDLAVGDGMFKSSDGGDTWEHIGLGDVQQVARVIVHPTNPEIVFVAGLGHPYGPNEERGVFRSTDGGTTWEKVLYIDHNTGAIQVEFDPTNPEILFADMWDHREGPWENARFSGTDSGLYKSTDGGTTWRRLSKGLPTAEQGLGRIGVGIAPSDPSRMYATVQANEGGGTYRSDDAGESWYRISTDNRLHGRGGDFGEIKVHPENPDRVYVGNVASYQSDDAGKTALQRGPIVYCLEQCDNAHAVRSLVLPDDAALEAKVDKKLFGGVPVIRGTALRPCSVGWRGKLYRPADELVLKPTRFTAVPYCYWDNREPGAMTIWMPRR